MRLGLRCVCRVAFPWGAAASHPEVHPSQVDVLVPNARCCRSCARFDFCKWRVQAVQGDRGVRSEGMSSEAAQSTENTGQSAQAPVINLAEGGGAICGMGEKFAANLVTGTGSMPAPIATSPGRSGFGPRLSLSHDSGAGNGPFGFGWSLSLPSITSKTDKGLPQSHDPGSESLENLPIGVDGTAYQWTDPHGAVAATWQVMTAATQTTVSSYIDSGSRSDER